MATINADKLGVLPTASVEYFGRMPCGTPVHRIFLQSRLGDALCGAAILTRGATLQSVTVPDKSGQVQDVVLGLDTLEGYNGGTNFCYGGTPGRVANRIAHGRFTLQGEQYQVTANWTGPSGQQHALHGGAAGFDRKIWNISRGPWVDDGGAHVELSLHSPAGDEGFPGDLDTTVRYTWCQRSEGSYSLDIAWSATADRPTIVNLTNHAYFNLSGVETASKVLDTHTVTLNCDSWTEVNDDAIPSGQLLSVEGTAMDFRTPKKLGERISETPNGGKGYDHNFVVNADASTPPGVQKFVGRIDCTSGRRLECWATQPGVQLFTMQPAEVFDMTTHGKYGQVYPVHGGVCLETQHFPDSANHPHFPSTMLVPGQKYAESCSYRFSVV
eukprot:TRINITY_DN72234_c0_g1_i1.p1 TRINITY_DN72234_c0_g1~~TRINITY_DN72234_c0_g1_i1.p1  ORF type:complete len:385 (-),score=56.83 TRINITY_DN72234_c0_g1_i1:70-1224(-)